MGTRNHKTICNKIKCKHRSHIQTEYCIQHHIQLTTKKSKGTRHNINSNTTTVTNAQTYWLYHGYEYKWLEADECLYPFNTSNIATSYLCQVSQKITYLHIYQLKFCKHFSSLLYACIPSSISYTVVTKDWNFTTATYCLKSMLLSPPALSQWLLSITSAQIKLLLLEGCYVNIHAFNIASVTHQWLSEFYDSFSIHDTRDVNIKCGLSLALFTLYTIFTHTLGTVTFIFTNLYYYVMSLGLTSIISFLLVAIFKSSSSECGLLQTILHTLVGGGGDLFICQTRMI
jgi:hypothetical protein